MNNMVLDFEVPDTILIPKHRLISGPIWLIWLILPILMP